MKGDKMREYDIFPASSSNQITAEYYFVLVEQINNGACSQKVQRILRKNGNHTYFTYHLITVM